MWCLHHRKAEAGLIARDTEEWAMESRTLEGVGARACGGEGGGGGRPTEARGLNSVL